MICFLGWFVARKRPCLPSPGQKPGPPCEMAVVRYGEWWSAKFVRDLLGLSRSSLTNLGISPKKWSWMGFFVLCSELVDSKQCAVDIVAKMSLPFWLKLGHSRDTDLKDHFSLLLHFLA